VSCEGYYHHDSQLGPKACWVTVNVLIKYKTEQCSKSFATMIQEREYIGKRDRSGHPPHYVVVRGEPVIRRICRNI